MVYYNKMFILFLFLSLIENLKKWKRQKHYSFLLIIYNDVYIYSMAIIYFLDILLKYYIRLYINI